MGRDRISDHAKGKQKASGSSPPSSTTTTAATVATDVGSLVSGDLHSNSIPRDFRSYIHPSARSDPRALIQGFIYALGRVQSLIDEAKVELAVKGQLAPPPPPPPSPSSPSSPPPSPPELQSNSDLVDLDPIPDLEPDHDHDHDHDGEGEFAEEMYPTVPCPCPCHENNEQHEGRPWLPFSNAAYVACPLCWVDAYMHANGDEGGGECDRYLRGRGKDPNMPAAVQC